MPSSCRAGFLSLHTEGQAEDRSRLAQVLSAPWWDAAWWPAGLSQVTPSVSASRLPSSRCNRPCRLAQGQGRTGSTQWWLKALFFQKAVLTTGPQTLFSLRLTERLLSQHVWVPVTCRPCCTRPLLTQHTPVPRWPASWACAQHAHSAPRCAHSSWPCLAPDHCMTRSL